MVHHLVGLAYIFLPLGASRTSRTSRNCCHSTTTLSLGRQILSNSFKRMSGFVFLTIVFTLLEGTSQGGVTGQVQVVSFVLSTDLCPSLVGVKLSLLPPELVPGLGLEELGWFGIHPLCLLRVCLCFLLLGGVEVMLCDVVPQHDLAGLIGTCFGWIYHILVHALFF